jgi:hypothetical protein
MGNPNNIISPDLQFIPILYKHTNVKSYYQPELGQFIIGNILYDKGIFGYYRYIYNKTGLYPSTFDISKNESLDAVVSTAKELTPLEIEEKKKLGIPVFVDLL